MSFTELLEELHKLSPEELEQVQNTLNGMRPNEEVEETPELLAAIDEGKRSLQTEPAITLDQLRQEMLTWKTPASE